MAHERFEECIAACNRCATECDHCAIACTNEADPKPLARCVALDLDCAAICRLAVAYMGRDSEFAVAICASCAEVCEACAAECEKHSMEHCRRCAEACRGCAQGCRVAQKGSRSKGAPASGAHAH
jgi:hypothetical protein